MPTQLRFKQVDVFTTRACMGNPVAVVFDPDARLHTEDMQLLARWTNLSETTFLLPATTNDADYKLRIFTPGSELPFAGHPTVGSAHAALEAGLVSSSSFVQECGAGLLPLTVTQTDVGQLISVVAPDAKVVRDYGDQAESIRGCLQAEIAVEPIPAALANGPTWLFVAMPSDQSLTKVQPDMARLADFSRQHGLTGIAAFSLVDNATHRVHIRCFAPAAGVYEDPVTGSANAALPAYLAHVRQLKTVGTEYVSSQGTELGRDGHVFVHVLNETGRAQIGGHSLTLIDGTLRF